MSLGRSSRTIAHPGGHLLQQQCLALKPLLKDLPEALLEIPAAVFRNASIVSGLFLSSFHHGFAYKQIMFSGHSSMNENILVLRSMFLEF